jgi:hypothetical protein
MNLWIRSQDKERLIKPIDFYIEETIDYVNKSSEFDIYALNLANDDIRIGTYKSKERAIEILYEIQNIFSLNIENMSYNEADLFLKAKMLDSCYEMPKE